MSKRKQLDFVYSEVVDGPWRRAEKAIHELVVLAAGSNPHDSDMAMEALLAVGALASAPLVTVIPQVPWEERRRKLVNLLREIPQLLYDLNTPMAIMGLARTDTSPVVRAAAQECSRVLRQRAHERGERRAQLRDLQWDATQDAGAKAAMEREAAG